MTKQLLPQSKYFTATSLKSKSSKVQKSTTTNKVLKEQIEKLEKQAELNRPVINFKTSVVPKSSSKATVQTFVANDTDVNIVHYYPKTAAERNEFINPVTKKKITEFQYKVYDLLAQVPRGQVTSYKALSDALGSHPRAVGGACRRNPFWPLPVPCHRVVASDGNIGGFMGDSGDCQFVANKKAKLIIEGNHFDDNYNFLTNSKGSKDMFTDFLL